MTRIGAGVSQLEAPVEALREATSVALADLGGASVDLAFIFMSPHHVDNAEEIVGALHDRIGPRHLAGCAAQGVVARSNELEEGPGLAVWVGSLPKAEITVFHAEALESDEGFVVAGVPDVADPEIVVLLADPFSFPAAGFVQSFNEEHRGVPVVGGIAVAGTTRGEQALIVEDEIHETGAAGVIIAGIPVRAVVSQGCAPIGNDSVITQADGNVVYELAGEPALDRLRAEIAELPAETQELVAQGLLAGLVINENKPDYARGDFLIRGLLAADEESGALQIGEAARVGQTLRFHVRDAESATEDLQETFSSALGGTPTAGALLFTCNGRGSNMFPDPDHDASLVSALLGKPSLAGFFCGGEIGPVGGRSFLHGFTATMAVFPE